MLEHRWTIRTATGGASATRDHVARLQSVVRAAARENGYEYGRQGGPGPMDPGRRALFDAQLARAVMKGLPISAAEAAQPGLWCFVGAVVAPELVRWRFWSETGTTAGRFLGSRLRNMYGRVWWRARLLRDETAEDPLWLLDALGEDEMVQITERPNAAGYGPLAVALGTSIVANWEEGMPVNRPNLLRDVMKRVLRLLPLLSMEMLEPEEVAEEVGLLVRESLRSLGVEPLDGTEEVELERGYDRERRWLTLSRDRRYRLVDALSDDEVARLEPLVNRSLPDHREYSPRWRVHAQLDGTLGQVVEVLGDHVEGLPGVDIGPWLDGPDAGSWATDTDPGRAASFVGALTEPDLQNLFARVGWDWADDQTWSGAQRMFRRRYDGDWEDVLLAFDEEGLERLARWAQADPQVVGRERLQHIARWLTVDPALAWPEPGVAPELREEVEVEPPPSAEPRSGGPSTALSVEPEPATRDPRLSEPLPEPPTLIRNKLLRAGIRTVGELLSLDAEQLSSIPGVGRKKLETILKFRQEVGSGMRGDAVAPGVMVAASFDTLKELDQWMFEALEDKVATAFALRFDERKTLAEVGDALGVSREYGRQLVNRGLQRLHARVGPEATRLLDAEAGLALLERAIFMADPVPHLLAVACVSSGGTSWTETGTGGLLWKGTKASLKAFSKSVDQVVGPVTELNGPAVERIAAGLDAPSALVELVLLQLLGWARFGEVLQLSVSLEADERRWVAMRMRAHGEPVHQDVVGSWVAASGAEAPDASDDRYFSRLAERMLDRNPQVLRYERGTFIHVDNLGVDRKHLASLVDRCVEWVVAGTGPVGVADLLERLADEGHDVADVNAYVLKNLLVMREEVKPMRKGLVAPVGCDLDSYSGVMEELIADAMREFGRPVSVQDLMGVLGGKFAETSVQIALSSKDRFVNLRKNEWVLRDQA